MSNKITLPASKELNDLKGLLIPSMARQTITGVFLGHPVSCILSILKIVPSLSFLVDMVLFG